MRRSEALASLSRDHHHALVVAQRLRRATADSADSARAAFLGYWGAHGRMHFRLGEEMLLPAYAAYGNAHHPLVHRALGDHVAIRQRVDVLASPGTVRLDAIHEFGVLLERHVRLEERELFPLIEGAMPAAELSALTVALMHAERSFQ